MKHGVVLIVLCTWLVGTEQSGRVDCMGMDGASKTGLGGCVYRHRECLKHDKNLLFRLRRWLGVAFHEKDMR